MTTIAIDREHTLGLAKARQFAKVVAKELAKRFDMTCETTAHADHETVTFHRAGVRGALVARADRVEVEAKLGLLMTAFASTIRTEIERQLDESLGGAAAAAPARKRARRTAQG